MKKYIKKVKNLIKGNKTTICMALVGIAIIAAGICVKNNKKEVAPVPVEESIEADSIQIDTTIVDSIEVVGKL